MLNSHALILLPPHYSKAFQTIRSVSHSFQTYQSCTHCYCLYCCLHNEDWSYYSVLEPEVNILCSLGDKAQQEKTTWRWQKEMRLGESREGSGQLRFLENVWNHWRKGLEDKNMSSWTKNISKGTAGGENWNVIRQLLMERKERGIRVSGAWLRISEEEWEHTMVGIAGDSCIGEGLCCSCTRKLEAFLYFQVHEMRAVILNIALAFFFFFNYSTKSQRTKEFLQARVKSLEEISQGLSQEAVFNTVIADVQWWVSSRTRLSVHWIWHRGLAAIQKHAAYLASETTAGNNLTADF